MLAFIAVLAFITLLVVFSYFGRSNDDYHNDPMLDPMSNPNIRVGHVQ